jgi:hypothetical protein
MKSAVATLVLAAFLAAGTARAQFVPDSVITQPPPPAPRFESVPPPPGPGLAWSPGRWVWDGAAWRWFHGRYRSKLLARDMYIRGYWQRHAGAGFGWTPGTLR